MRVKLAPRVLDLCGQLVLVTLGLLGIEFGFGCQFVKAVAQDAQVFLRSLDLLTDGLGLHFGSFWYGWFAWLGVERAQLIETFTC